MLFIIIQLQTTTNYYNINILIPSSQQNLPMQHFSCFWCHHAMKHLLLLPALIISCLLTKAQIKKGSLLLGGSFSYITLKNDDPIPNYSKTNQGSINLSIGKARKENTIYGINLIYMGATFLSTSNGQTTTTPQRRVYGLGVFYRKYKKIEKDLYFYYEAGASFTIGKNTSSDTSVTTSGSYNETAETLYFSPGISYKISKKIHLEVLVPNLISANYTVYKTKFPYRSYIQKVFSLNTGLGGSLTNFFGVGVRIII